VALRGLYAALRRQLTLIIAVVILSLALGVAYVLVAPKKYTSETSVLVDMRRPGLFNNGQGLQLSTVDSSAIDSQVELLRSERVALRVIQKLNLLEDPNQIRGTSSLGFVKSAVYERLGMEGEPETPQTIQRSVLEAFQRNTRVEREGLTYVITISYSAFDRDLAARIANAIAAAYLTDQLEAKLEATRLANTWLEERVTDLRAGLLKAETAVATYKSQNNIVDAAGTLVNERELNEINTQLVNARAQLGETQARFDRIQALIDRKDVGNATINDVINSTSVQRLRGQYQDLARRESDIRRRLGPSTGR
jgi:succinoglycan biosynthesis transport protein ExoP